MSAASQYKQWCHYLFEHGQVSDNIIKHIFGLPLRLSSGVPTLTHESPNLLEAINPDLKSLKDLWGPVHGLNLNCRANIDLRLNKDVAQVTFIGKTHASVSILVSQSKTLTMVHATTLLYSSYVQWLFEQQKLILSELILIFSKVFTIEEEEAYIREQLLFVESKESDKEDDDICPIDNFFREEWDD